MQQFKPTHAFILAAGKGTRLKPYTDAMPKPMVEINGRPIIAHIVDKLKEIGVQNITINLHHLGDRIKDYFKDWTSPQFIFSEETELLETGGGVKLALHTMDNAPFFLINGDAFWEDKIGQESALMQLTKSWDPSKMDILLLLQKSNQMKLTKSIGDYNMKEDGVLTRTSDGSGQYMFTGIRITKPDVFASTRAGAFSFRDCMDKAQEQNRLYGVEYNGQWHHISTPQDLHNVNNAIKSQTTPLQTKGQ